MDQPMALMDRIASYSEGNTTTPAHLNWRSPVASVAFALQQLIETTGRYITGTPER